MTTPFSHSKTEFYLTAPAPCPYLEGRKERKIFSFLGGPEASQINAALSKRGFRRSQNILYLPACDACSACRPVRVVTKDFTVEGSRKRVMKRNTSITRVARGPKATSDQFSVLRGYLDARHFSGGMADMTVLDYTSMVEQTSVDTLILEYWDNLGTPEQRLIACSLTDRLDDGLSMVYSFFDPDFERRSLGTYMILDHIAYARELELDYVYLGYWVRGSKKMSYKADFQPTQMLTSRGWRLMTASDTQR